MSSLYRAWFTFLGLGLLTLILTALVGIVPAELSSAIAMPHNLLYRAGSNVRVASNALADRRDLRALLAAAESRNADLDERNRDLALRVEQLQEVVQIHADQSPGVTLTAPVTGISTSVLLERLTLGRGARDGVLVGMPVTVPQGLIGLVTETTAGTAVVRAVTDPQSRVGVTVRSRGGQGIALGLPGGQIRVVDFIESEPVQAGDFVETSSFGGIFPRGVLVGEVIEVIPKDPNTLRRSFVLRPAVDMSTVLEVALIAPQ